MLVAVVATFCQIASPSTCAEEIITNEATLSECTGGFAQPALAKWMAENIHYRTGWRLEKWACHPGGYHKKIGA